jgi:CheY-like chemotaxis protein
MILLVEDDPADARLIQRALSKAGVLVPVVRLTDGEDVVSYLRGDHPYENRKSYPMPTLILLDIKLPKKNGFEVLEWLRKQKDVARRTLVVMFTSSNHAVDIGRAYDLGANSYLVKPESSAQLLEIANMVNRYWLEFNQGPAFGVSRGV